MTSSRRLVAASATAIAVLLTGCGGGATAGDDAGGGNGSSATFTGTDGLKFEPETATVTAGEVTITLASDPGIEHNFVIEELDDELVVETDRGETDSGTVELEPGQYTFYCSVPGHRQAGMAGTLTAE